MSIDNEIKVSAEQLQASGFIDIAQARKNLELLQRVMGETNFLRIRQALLVDLRRCADPDMALNNLERFINSLNDIPAFLSLCEQRPFLFLSLTTVFGASRFLSAFLMSDADRSISVLSDPEFLASYGKQELAARLMDFAGGKAEEKVFFQRMRLFRKQEMLRIGLRDLLNKSDLRETVQALSHLAEVCLQAGCEWAQEVLAGRYGRPMMAKADGSIIAACFTVIGMGKLGGSELNFSSDVDLMYVYTADGETEGVRQGDGSVTNRITNHEYFIKLSEKLSSAIGQKTEDGFVFRVDLRLRPEGQGGPLAQSLGGYEIYYESWGQTWERSALIKARTVAGDDDLGREFLERISPFVYRKYLDYNAIHEIGEMKQKINKDVEQKGRTFRDVKLGYGGIREIEFVIQALQLIYAGRDRTLREKNALKALHILAQKGLITYEEQEVLVKAYIFLRTVEHRIQLLDDLQTQTIPSDASEVRTLARRSGYRDQGREEEQLLRDYAEHTRKVRSIYNDLFAYTAEDQTGQRGAPGFALLLDLDTSEQEAVGLFRQHGFRDPGKAWRNLLLLREGSAFVHQTPRSRKLFNQIFPSLLAEIVSSPDPDMALNHLESFLSAQGSWESFQSLLKFDVSSGRVLIAIFANSEYLSRMLISRPVLLQNLLESRKDYGAGTAAVYARGLAQALERGDGITEKLDILRRFKHQEEIRIGLADLLSPMNLRAVSRDLSKLAEVCLDAALKLAVSEIGRHLKASCSFSGLAVIGAGKLGGRELTYASDLDILFVFTESKAGTPPGDLTVFEFFSKVAEKTISYLSTLTREGFAFRIDTRLRPTGSKGPLVQSVDAFRSYYSKEAETWERQALLRARHVAGDGTVGRDFCGDIRKVIFRDEDRMTLARDITTMRRRMEEEVGKEEGGAYNIKQGAGGLVDIEFTAQYLQLLHGKKHPRVQVPGTENALRALYREGLLPRSERDVLLSSYEFLRKLESRMRIVSNQAGSELPKDGLKIQALARRMGYQDKGDTAAQHLLGQYQAISSEVRDRFVKLLKQ